MDSIYEEVKSFLLEEVNARLPEGLAKFTDKCIVFGLVDVTKYSGAKILVSVLPEKQSLGNGNAVDVAMDNEILVTLICGSGTFEDIQKNTVLYAKAFEQCIFEKTQWNGNIESVNFESADYTFDAGTVSGQLSAAEIRLTVTTVIEDESFDDLFE